MKPIKLSYDMYYSHKEYSDSALISLLERQQDQIQKLKEKCLIYDATIYKLRGKIKIQKMMLDELKYASKVNKDFYKEIEKLIVENERLTEENNLLKSEVEYFRLNHIPEYIKLFQRMKRYKKEHLMFLYDFNVSYTNNNAERALRMIKTRKKVSGQVLSIDRGNQLLSLL